MLASSLCMLPCDRCQVVFMSNVLFFQHSLFFYISFFVTKLQESAFILEKKASVLKFCFFLRLTQENYLKKKKERFLCFVVHNLKYFHITLYVQMYSKSYVRTLLVHIVIHPIMHCWGDSNRKTHLYATLEFCLLREFFFKVHESQSPASARPS